MQEYYHRLADHLSGCLQGEEVLTSYYSGEQSDFVRFNKGVIRQPGTVTQAGVTLRLILGRRHTSASLPVSGTAELDRPRCERALEGMRARLAVLPEDPYLLYSTDPTTSETEGEDRLPAAADAVGEVLRTGQDRDLVGIYASGRICRGFTSSLGHRFWFSSCNFNLNWSVYAHADKAVKCDYAGFSWEPEAFDRKVEDAAEQVEVLRHPPRELQPGKYRVYLSPTALEEITGMMSWGGFGLRSHRTKTTPFLKLAEGKSKLNPQVTVLENTAEGTAPDFNQSGFRKPPQVTLVHQGLHSGCLVSPRSAMEFGVETNGAESGEFPASLELAPGSLPTAEVLKELDTGLLVNNLWYLNFSDRNAFRLTGMTRFATFWVERGQIVAPTNVMRFDESVYRMLGDRLLGLTRDREMILSPSTYGGRGVESARLPGAVVGDFSFTL